jgi:hypothetical protein
LLKFRVVFAISGDFLAINLTNPNRRYGFSCLAVDYGGKEYIGFLPSYVKNT